MAFSATEAMPVAAAGAPAPSQTGYGTDPVLRTPVAPWRLLMTPRERALTALLADIILPAAGAAPAASAVGVVDYLNEWTSAPYPKQQRDRRTLRDGFRWLDAEAQRRSGALFGETSQEVRLAIFGDITADAQPWLAKQRKFFFRLRSLVAGAYYSTPEGFVDIGYIGNRVLDAYPVISNAERAILDEELRRLGL